MLTGYRSVQFWVSSPAESLTAGAEPAPRMRGPAPGVASRGLGASPVDRFSEGGPPALRAAGEAADGKGCCDGRLWISALPARGRLRV